MPEILYVWYISLKCQGENVSKCLLFQTILVSQVLTIWIYIYTSTYILIY